MAFLQLMHLPPSSAVTAACQEMARRAQAHCEKCAISQWRIATEGEALLILGKLNDGIARYKEAITITTSQLQIDSMYGQALRIAERMYGENGLTQIEQAFGLHR